MKRFLSLLLVFSLTVSIVVPVVLAQDNQDEDDNASSVELVGTVEAVGSGTITVDGFVIDVSNIDPATVATVSAGSNVRVQGFLDSGSVTATSLEVLQSVAVDEAILNVEKYLSTDNTNWIDANETPGEQIPLDADLYFRIVITNNSDTELTGLTLDDNVYDVSTCVLPETLSAGQSIECVIGAFSVDAGAQTSFSVASALYNGEIITDNDAVYYFGGVLTQISIKKYVSVDGATWDDANSTPGLLIEDGSDVFFRIVVENTGDAPLTNIVLTDTRLDLSGCSIPESLEAGASFECVLGPLPADEDWHTSTATVTAFADAVTVSDFDRAIYYAGEDTSKLPVVIIIEGPVAAINANIVTIYDIDIEIDVNDPVLIDIEIGDDLRVEGDVIEDGDTIIVIAINVVIINIIIIDYNYGVPSGCKVSKNGKIKCSGKKKSKRS